MLSDEILGLSVSSPMILVPGNQDLRGFEIRDPLLDYNFLPGPGPDLACELGRALSRAASCLY